MLTLTFTPFPVLITERLTLRQLSVNDDKEIFALRSDQQVNKYIDRAPSNTIEDARKFIHKIEEVVRENKGIYWAITLTNHDNLVGTICLFNFLAENDQAEIGYELLPTFQGQGIMQEAILKVIGFGLQVIGLKTIEAYTHIENVKSTKLLEKNNFKKQENIDSNSDSPYVLFKLNHLMLTNNPTFENQQ
ncbi:GNAT family N-acetyltransferase [Pedobacter polaris]|uniref:GNAT family N-acetyltransferase n=1 Tax=Pedobacter polaris TaxID=2571273 RepID=A0A4U1CEQ8_9SPHI|nr:GNAT family N-acetyltransferase [Pedobacter polaris]TKC05546.1 GNAT family N-acetyltransferase [Pedobacter polaris]